MADYSGEYGHPYPRVDQYGNPVPPVDQYGNPIPRELGLLPTYSSEGIGDMVVAPADYGAGMASTAYPHEGVILGGGGAVSPNGATEAYTHDEGALSGGSLAPGETTAYAYDEGVVGSGIIAGDQLQSSREKEEHTTLGETLRRSGSSSSSSSSEDDGQGGRQRRKKSIKEKIKEKFPGSNNSNKQEEHKGAGHAVPAAAGTGTHAAATHEKKGIMQKIKEKLPGHH